MRDASKVLAIPRAVLELRACNRAAGYASRISPVPQKPRFGEMSQGSVLRAAIFHCITDEVKQFVDALRLRLKLLSPRGTEGLTGVPLQSSAFSGRNGMGRRRDVTVVIG